MKDDNDLTLTHAFSLGVLLTMVVLVVFGGLFAGFTRRDGIALLESDTDARILMTSTFFSKILFATDAGYILYDGDRLYIEMDRCVSPDTEAGQ